MSEDTAAPDTPPVDYDAPQPVSDDGQNSIQEA